jgi:hypothetical protein
MYKIIGVDHQEYGPINADQMRQWIAEGRANGQTKVQLEGAADWKPLANFPEFLEALSAKSAPAVPVGPPPRVDAVNPDALAEEIIARRPEVDIGKCVGRSWELLTKNFFILVGTSALAFVVVGVVASIPYLGVVAGPAAFGLLQGGLFTLFLKLIRGQKTDFSDVFVGFGVAFAPLALAGVISHLLIGVGLLCCVLPGIYLAIAWLFTFPLVIDKKLDFWPALELSRKVATSQWWPLFGLVIVNILLLGAGVLCCFAGFFVALPVVTGALAYAYEDTFNPSATPVA